MAWNCAFLKSATHASQYPAPTLPEVALMGRSNVGKSSLINALAKRRDLARTSKTPGRTQTLNFYLCDDRFILVDLPGYGYAAVPEPVRAAWGRMVEEYLAGRPTLRGAFLLIDGRHGPTKDDLELWEWLRWRGLRAFAVATKWDKVKTGQRVRRLKEMEARLGKAILPVSAVSGEGLQRAAARLLELALSRT